MKTLRYVLLVFFFVCPVLNAQDIPAWYRTATVLNLRKEPSAHSPIIYKAVKGEEMMAIGVVGDWFRVVYRKDTLYASSRYLEFSTFTDDEIEEEALPQHKPKFSWSFSFWGIIWWLVKIAILLFVIYKVSKLLTYGVAILYMIVQGVYKVASIPFRITNWLQRWLSKPWRALYKYNSGNDAKNEEVDGYLWMAQLPLYVLLTPLRFVNAFFFNMIAHCFFESFNYILEVLLPSNEKEGDVDDMLMWLLWLPWRIIKYLCWHLPLTVIESAIWTVADTIYPALTLYHGTSHDAAYNIVVSPGRTWGGNMQTGIWNIGGGNYAGDGIYFAPVMPTAEHYSGNGCIIVTRVSLGSVLDLGLAPCRIYRQCGHPNAKGVTKYGLDKGYTTGEWWRSDSGWWEYCMYDWQNRYNESWRIRPLYVIDLQDSRNILRIPGGMSHWLFRKMVIKDLQDFFDF